MERIARSGDRPGVCDAGEVPAGQAQDANNRALGAAGVLALMAPAAAFAGDVPQLRQLTALGFHHCLEALDLFGQLPDACFLLPGQIVDAFPDLSGQRCQVDSGGGWRAA